MSESSKTKYFYVDGVLTDADADPTAVVSYDGEPDLDNTVTHDGTGVYTCTVTDPAPSLVYTFTWTFVYETVEYSSVDTVYGPAEGNDLITAAEAVAEPPLSAVALDNARLLQLISVASAGVQRYLGRWYTPAEIAAGLDADLKLAVALFTAYLWERSAAGVKVDYEREGLGDYFYAKSRGFEGGSAPSPRLDLIGALLEPFKLRGVPFVVLCDSNTPWRS